MRSVVSNLRTRRPLDHEGFTAGLTGSANFGDFSEEIKPQASLLLSNTWETDHGTFGALVDVAYSELATRTDSTTQGGQYVSQTSTSGTGKVTMTVTASAARGSVRIATSTPPRASRVVVIGRRIVL